MRTKTALACGVVAAAAGACIFPSLDGLSGGDAGPDAGDATQTSDAAGEAVAPDAPGDAIGNAPAYCSTVDAAFCDDFDDEDGGTFTHWTTTSTFHGATITRAASDASAPFAARFDSFPSDAGTPVATLKQLFATPITSSATLAFDLRVDTWPTPSTAGLNSPQIALNGSASIVSLRLRQTNTQLEEVVTNDAGTTYPTFALAQSPQLGKWVHVEIDFTLEQQIVNASVLFDGTVVLAPTPLDASFAFGVPTLYVGEVFVDPGNQTSSFLVDDVVFRYQ